MASRYRVDLLTSVRKHLEKLPRAIQHRLVTAMTRLGADPRPPGVRKLRGQDDVLRIRVGEYRIIYRVMDRRLVVLVIRIGHRSEAYRAAALRLVRRRAR